MTATTNTVILAIADSSVCLLSMRFFYVDLISIFITVVLIPWTEMGVIGTPNTLGARPVDCPLIQCSTNKDCQAKGCGPCAILADNKGVSLINQARQHGS